MSLDLSVLDVPPARWLAPVAALSVFEEDPDNPRFEDDDKEFELLVEDIRLRGVLQPVVVRILPSGRLRLRFGRRRYRAACRLQLPGLCYVVTEDPRQFDDYAQVAENERRKALQPLELATFVASKLREGAKKKEVAAQLGIHPSAVTHLQVLVVSPAAWLLELYHSRRCRTPYYLYLLCKLMRRNAALVERAVAEAAQIDLTMIKVLTAQVRETVAPLQVASVGSTAVPDPAPSVAAAPQLRSRTSNRTPGIQLLGMHAGRPMVLLMVLPDTPGHCWVRYCDTGERCQVVLSGIVLTEVRDSADD